MAILEPVLSETVLGTCLTIVREAMDERSRWGWPEAARGFPAGTSEGRTGIVFQLFEGATFSDGALKAIAEAKKSCSGPTGGVFSNRRQLRKHSQDHCPACLMR